MKMLEIKVGRMAAMVAGAAPTRKLAGERERETGTWWSCHWLWRRPMRGVGDE